MLPEIQSAIEFIAASAASGIIGTKADSWFNNLYYHERSRITAWLSNCRINEDDKDFINRDPKLKVLFSQVISNVANEIFDQKLAIWPTITESLLKNSEFSFDKKQYFISMFIKLDPHTIHYLLTLRAMGPIDSQRVFPNDKEGSRPSMLEEEDFGFYLGQLQSASSGTTDLYHDKTTHITYFRITELGTQFLDFISNSSKDIMRVNK